MILIAGPCVIESKDILQKTINDLLKSISDLNVDFYFKSSWRKDNRTTTTGFSGINPQQAIDFLLDIKYEYKIKICTDVHTPEDFIKYDFSQIDLIQIPAYLAKQHSLLKEAAAFCSKHNLGMHIKKPQFVGPEDMINIANNAWKYGADKIIITDRGTQLGYNQVFMDPRHVPIMKRCSFPVLCDITHPNKNYPGDKVDNAITLGRAYIAAGADGIFLETHPDCENALCDGQVMIPSNQLKEVIQQIYE